MTRNVGLRELRQSASDVIRAVEAGERVTVTVAGRVVAEIAPPPTQAWQPATALAEIWSGDTYGPLDRDAFDDFKGISTLLDVREPLPNAGTCPNQR